MPATSSEGAKDGSQSSPASAISMPHRMAGLGAPAARLQPAPGVQGARATTNKHGTD